MPMKDENSFGLSYLQLERIRNSLNQCPRLNQAFIFGSRALGTYRNGSDIDIALDGDELTFEDVLRLHTRIDDLNLPYFVDLVHIQRIENSDLLDHIRMVGKKIFSRLPASIDCS